MATGQLHGRLARVRLDNLRGEKSAVPHPVKLLVESMVETSQQQLLREAWLEGKEGGLSAREQAKAWALREVWRHEGKPEHGMKAFIAGKLKKFSVKKEGRVAPTASSICKFFAKVDADDD